MSMSVHVRLEMARQMVHDAVAAEREACARIVEAAADNLFEDGKLSLQAVKLLLRKDVAVKIRDLEIRQRTLGV